MESEALEKKLELRLGLPGDEIEYNSQFFQQLGNTVVGWPPVGTFRKNIAGTSLKTLNESQIVTLKSEVKLENLVYEDNEGDKMLVGDVPWDMFVSMAKRLRVLKTSDLSSLSELRWIRRAPSPSNRSYRRSLQLIGRR